VKFYKGRWWRQKRLDVLRKNPLCEICFKNGKIEKATQVDHITPHKRNETLFLKGKLQSLCISCHSKKTRRENLDQNKRKDKTKKHWL